jgi:hypothetical protein
MKKYFYLFLIPVLFWGCEKKPGDNVINPEPDNFSVNSVYITDASGKVDSVFYSPDDSSIAVHISFNSISGLKSVSFDVSDPDNQLINSSLVILYDNGNASNGDQTAGDKIYSNKFPMSMYYLNGNYKINFQVTGSNNQVQSVAQYNFIFSNGANNVAPVISNSVVEPDTVVVTDTTVIFTSVEAADSNGVNDIVEVYFKVYKPDGTTNNSKIQLYDDGNTTEHGDVTGGDGIYSRLIQVNQTNDKGTYRFEFQARDHSGALSNIINHFVLIQ